MWAANENLFCRLLCFFVKSQHSHLPNFCSSCHCHGSCTVAEFCDFCETMLGSCKVTLHETVTRQCFTGRWKCEMTNSGWTKGGWSFMKPCFMFFCIGLASHCAPKWYYRKSSIKILSWLPLLLFWAGVMLCVKHLMSTHSRHCHVFCFHTCCIYFVQEGWGQRWRVALMSRCHLRPTLGFVSFTNSWHVYSSKQIGGHCQHSCIMSSLIFIHNSVRCE